MQDMKILLVAALAALSAAAQVISPTPIVPGQLMSADLRVYLEVTTDQTAAMNRLTAELRRFQADKARRSVQVQAELQDEMRKQTLDPMALGLRYVELEAIRRELLAKAGEAAGEIQKLFTPAQQTKLRALQEVLRGYPLACEALSLNLITHPDADRWFDTSSIIGTGSVGGVIFGVPGYGCGPLPVIRTGNFQGGIVNPGVPSDVVMARQ
jgi:hypothetical protein